jgi:hypothetical protein
MEDYGCNCGMGDLATSTYNKKLHRQLLQKRTENEDEYLYRKEELEQEKRALGEQKKAVEAKIKALKLAAGIKPKVSKKVVKHPSTEIACRSDKFAGGCTATAYTYPNGNEKTIIVSKVANPAKKKRVTTGEGDEKETHYIWSNGRTTKYASSAAYNAAKAKAEDKAKKMIQKDVDKYEKISQKPYNKLTNADNKFLQYYKSTYTV